MTTPTVHDVRLVKVRIALVDLGSVAKLADVVVQVPTLVLVKDGQGGVLLLVGPDLWTHTRLVFRQTYCSESQY